MAWLDMRPEYNVRERESVVIARNRRYTGYEFVKCYCAALATEYQWGNQPIRTEYPPELNPVLSSPRSKSVCLPPVDCRATYRHLLRKVPLQLRTFQYQFSILLTTDRPSIPLQSAMETQVNWLSHIAGGGVALNEEALVQAPQWIEVVGKTM